MKTEHLCISLKEEISFLVLLCLFETAGLRSYRGYFLAICQLCFSVARFYSSFLAIFYLLSGFYCPLMRLNRNNVIVLIDIEMF